MIEIFSKAASGELAREVVSLTDLRAVANSWISLEDPSREELDIATDRFQLKAGNLSDALDIHESPRLDHDNAHDYLYVRWPKMNKTGSTSTSPLLIVYNANDLLTVSPIKLDNADFLGTDVNFSMRSPKSILLQILTQIFNEYELYIKGQSESVKKIIEKMRHNKLESEDFIRFVLVEEQINSFMSALDPVVPLMRRLSTSKHLALTNNDRDVIEDIVLSVEQSIHTCNTNVARIVSVREAYAALSNNSLNRTMKALTAATFFIALPNVIFGMYGMNINLPIQHQPWAFIAIIAGTVTAIFAIILIAKRRHWF